MTQRTNCGHCHTCGHRLRNVLDGEEWCDHCQAYRRYQSHGWNQSRVSDIGEWTCPTKTELQSMREGTREVWTRVTEAGDERGTPSQIVSKLVDDLLSW